MLELFNCYGVLITIQVPLMLFFTSRGFTGLLLKYNIHFRCSQLEGSEQSITSALVMDRMCVGKQTRSLVESWEKGPCFISFIAVSTQMAIELEPCLK